MGATEQRTQDPRPREIQRRYRGKLSPAREARHSRHGEGPQLTSLHQDLEQVEDWNEHGELEDQIEDQVDIFGDVPISATSAEAHATAAARAQAQAEAVAAAKASGGAGSQARTASETRHISISDPKDEGRKGSASSGSERRDSPLSMAMRQAGAEAAAKGAQKKSSSGGSAVEVTKGTTAPRQRPLDESESAGTGTKIPPPEASKVLPKLDADSEEVSKVATGAKTPELLAAEGAKKTSLDKVATASSGSSTTGEEDEGGKFRLYSHV